MVSILVKNFQGLSVESKSFELPDKPSELHELKQTIAEHFKLNPQKFDLVQRGQCLREDQSVHLKQGDVLYALKRPRKVEAVTESVDEGTMKHVVSSMKKLLSKANTCALLESKMQSRDLLECIIEAVPAFGDDTTAIDVLSNTSLLTPIFSKKTSKPQDFLLKHPSMVHACLILIEEVKGDGGAAGSVDKGKQDSKALYSLDHMSDHDDDAELSTDEYDDDDDATTPSSSTHQRRSQGNPIRPFGAAGGPTYSPFTPNFQRLNAPPSSSSSNPPSTITPDFFRQAMQAINSGSNAPPLLPPLPLANRATTATTTTAVAATSGALVTEDQLAQMTELGVGDRALATSLLVQTNGDMQAAIALFYEIQDMDD